MPASGAAAAADQKSNHQDKSVSRHHAKITISGESATIEDLESKNGTFVRGERIDAPSRIGDGDAIRLGSVPMTFRVFSLSGSTETAEKK